MSLHELWSVPISLLLVCGPIGCSEKLEPNVDARHEAVEKPLVTGSVLMPDEQESIERIVTQVQNVGGCCVVHDTRVVLVFLKGTGITDSFLKHLEGLTIERLDLSETQITDDGGKPT
jgi:hypothetical protein